MFLNEPNSEQNAKTTWRERTESFENDAPWLGNLYGPQLQALYAYADALDLADSVSLTLVSEYARIHRWLLNKSAGAKADPEDNDSGPDLLDMLDANPGVRWKP